MMHIDQQIIEIRKRLVQNARPDTTASTHKFVPGSTRVYGNTMPLLNDLAKEFKTGGFDIVNALWTSGAFEEKMLAVKILGKISKTDPEKTMKQIQIFAPNIDNWALCDAIGMQAIKPILKTHQPQIFALAKKYNQSIHFWERRLSLVLVEWFTRDKNMHEQIMPLIENLEDDKEYYVKKAVAWIKRNMEKGK